ncbi:MAG TPA: ChbG/HpnK family deacetylase, partial [Anaerolineales bacterium]|nr:ChbG/HpnK family deacetylase [Anaerolineales bacterium]
LAVGLHLVAVSGTAVLPPKEVPHLVDSQGRFLNNAALAGLRYFFSKVIKEELAREITAQFERFAETGLPLSHVDGHLHMHVHPTIFNLVLPLAAQYGARGLRLPRDDARLALRYDAKHVGTKILWAVVFGLLSRWCSRQMETHPLVLTQNVYGLMQSGQMHEHYVVNLLNQLSVKSAEIYFHPDLETRTHALGPNHLDFETLVSPRIRRLVEERGLILATYPTLQGIGG